MTKVIVSIFFKILFIVFETIFISGFIYYAINFNIECIIYIVASIALLLIDFLFVGILFFSKKLYILYRFRIRSIEYDAITKIAVDLGIRSLFLGGCLLSFKLYFKNGKTLNCSIGQMFNEKYIRKKLTKLCEFHCIKLEFVSK